MNPRLIFFLPDSRGGVETFTNNYVNTISGCGIKVIKYKTIKALTAKIRRTVKGDIEQLQIGFSWYSTERSKYGMLRKLVDENDVLICDDSFELEFINYYGLKNKVVYILHGDLTHYKNSLDAYNGSMDLVLCVSNGLKSKYMSLFPELKFGVSHPFLLAVPEKEPSAGEKLNCVFIGKFEYQKGADLFLDLVKSFEDEMNWTVAAIADGSEASLLGRIPSYVKIYMDLPNEKVLQLLSEADVLIFPSRTEGFGIAVLEAMSRGVVPIVLNIPIGIPDQVIHGYNGFIVDAENWSEVGSCLEKLGSGSHLLIEMKKNAIRFVKDNFNSKSIVADFVNQINSVSINKEKRFFARRSQRLALLPEPIYRALKFVRSRIKVGDKQKELSS